MAKKSALAKEPPMAQPKSQSVSAAVPKLQRVSPGIYRNAQKQLVGSRGQQLPGRRPMPQQSAPTAANVPNQNQQQMVGNEERFANISDVGNQQNIGQGLSSMLPNNQYQPQWREPAPMRMNEQFMGDPYFGQPQPMMQQPMMQSLSPQALSEMYQWFQKQQAQSAQAPNQPGQEPMVNNRMPEGKMM